MQTDKITDYQRRTERGRKLKEEGLTVIGYFGSQAPVELITAAGAVPFRITGNIGESINQADAHLESSLCPFVRNCFELTLRGDYDFFDGMIIPHVCDTLERVYPVWRSVHSYSFIHLLVTPHMIRPTSVEFFMHELETLRKKLAEFTGRVITDQEIRQAIARHNEVRGLLREGYRLRKNDCPYISAGEVTGLALDSTSMPADETVAFLKDKLKVLKTRPEGQANKPVRLLVYGSEADASVLMELIEDCGADVVMDDLDVGSRSFWTDVEVTDNPLEGLARHYLLDDKSPRTYVPREGTYRQDLQKRFGYLGEYVKEFKVNGAILYIMRYCDTHEFDAPDVTEYFKSLGVPVLYLEEEYSLANVGQIRTRIEAFVEMIGQG